MFVQSEPQLADQPPLTTVLLAMEPNYVFGTFMPKRYFCTTVNRFCLNTPSTTLYEQGVRGWDWAGQVPFLLSPVHRDGRIRAR